MSVSSVSGFDQTRPSFDNSHMVIENMYQTKTHLSRLVEQALAGEDVLISRSGKPLVRLLPYEERLQPVVFGLAHGEIRISHDFDELSHDIAGLFDEYLPE
jgi:prevent-host-death family protein